MSIATVLAPSRNTAYTRPGSNQIEIYFSIAQRNVLTPNDFDSLAQVARSLNDFECHYNTVAEPSGWKFTRDKLNDLITRLASPNSSRSRPDP